MPTAIHHLIGGPVLGTGLRTALAENPATSKETGRSRRADGTHSPAWTSSQDRAP